jgi:hypothetical protein
MMARYVANLLDSCFMGRRLRRVTDKSLLNSRFTYGIAESRPVTGSAPNVWIGAVAIDATATDSILFEVKEFRIWQPIDNLPKSANFRTSRADKSTDSLSLICVHTLKIVGRTDKFRSMGSWGLNQQKERVRLSCPRSNDIEVIQLN